MNKKNDFIVGNVFTTKKCGSVKVIEYESNTKVKVLFLDTDSEQYVTLQRLRSGGITDKFSKTYNGIGAIGNTTTKKDGKFKNSFLKWRCMLKRCGDKTCGETAKYGAYASWKRAVSIESLPPAGMSWRTHRESSS